MPTDADPPEGPSTPASPEKSRKERWAAAFGPSWLAGIASALIVAAVIAIAVTVLSGGDDGNPRAPTADKGSPGSAAPHPLRATIVAADPGVFQLAFARDIGLPDESTDWQDLIDQGGIPVGTGLFKVTLANRSKERVTVRDIHAEVVRSDPPPTGSLAYAFTQGDQPLGQFAVRITSATPKAKAHLYAVTDGTPGWNRVPPDKPFFDDNYISLRPGEIYEAQIAVQANLPAPRMVSYRFAISGSTPERNFVTRDRGIERLSGLDDDRFEDPKYDHYYVEGYLAHTQANQCPSLEVKRWFAEPRRPVATPCP